VQSTRLKVADIELELLGYRPGARVPFCFCMAVAVLVRNSRSWRRFREAPLVAPWHPGFPASPSLPDWLDSIDDIAPSLSRVDGYLEARRH